MQPRLLITQPEHADRWNVPDGRFALVRDDESVEILGQHFHASVLAVRFTAILVREWYSKKTAIETYHNPNCKAYRELRDMACHNRGGPPFAAEGPELLLYIHGLNHPATYLLASKLAKNEFTCARSYFYPGNRIDASQVPLFTVKKTVGFGPHYSPMLISTDLQWRRAGRRQWVEEFMKEGPRTSPMARRLRENKLRRDGRSTGAIYEDGENGYEDDDFLTEAYWPDMH